MAKIQLPPITPKKKLNGANYGLSGYGVYQESQPITYPEPHNHPHRNHGVK